MKDQLFKICKEVNKLDLSISLNNLYEGFFESNTPGNKHLYFQDINSGGYFHTVLMMQDYYSSNPSSNILDIAQLSTSEIDILAQGNSLFDILFQNLISETNKLPLNIRHGLNPKFGFKEYLSPTKDITLPISFQNDLISIAHLFSEVPLIHQTIAVYQQFSKSDKKIIKDVDPKVIGVMVNSIENEVLKMDDPYALLNKIRGKRITSLDDGELMTFFLFNLYCVRATITICLDTIYSSILNHPLIVISKDNLITIKKDVSNMFTHKREFVLEPNYKLNSALSNFGSLVLMKYEKGSTMIHEFGRLEKSSISYGSEQCELATVGVIVLDENLCPYNYDLF